MLANLSSCRRLEATLESKYTACRIALYYSFNVCKPCALFFVAPETADIRDLWKKAMGKDGLHCRRILSLWAMCKVVILRLLYCREEYFIKAKISCKHICSKRNKCLPSCQTVYALKQRLNRHTALNNHFFCFKNNR